MRSSKSRSRSKQNRSRSVGNVINRVFDSSGPEGKVRGTPQQIIDKYNQLARDAQLSNDRVAAENFQQHSEHYTRMLSEATREMESQRQSSQGDYGNQGGGQGGNPNGGNSGGQNSNNSGNQNGYNAAQTGNGGGNPQAGQQNRQDRNRDDSERGEQSRSRDERPARDDRPARDERRPRDTQAEAPMPELPAFLTQPAPAGADAFAVDGPDTETDSGLVETPESAPKPKTTRSRKPKAKPPEAAE